MAAPSFPKGYTMSLLSDLIDKGGAIGRNVEGFAAELLLHLEARIAALEAAAAPAAGAAPAAAATKKTASTDLPPVPSV